MTQLLHHVLGRSSLVCRLKINRSIFSLHWHFDTAVPDAPGTDATLKRYNLCNFWSSDFLLRQYPGNITREIFTQNEIRIECALMVQTRVNNMYPLVLTYLTTNAFRVILDVIRPELPAGTSGPVRAFY